LGVSLHKTLEREEEDGETRGRERKARREGEREKRKKRKRQRRGRERETYRRISSHLCQTPRRARWRYDVLSTVDG
jgi:hypothetical protein